ncbi:hypothetical protein PTI98_005332 [Pleurotus ostreatus]|nr:hypothetical protein PTI98_005332 [Pleurotus ostreatus]
MEYAALWVVDAVAAENVAILVNFAMPVAAAETAKRDAKEIRAAPRITVVA